MRSIKFFNRTIGLNADITFRCPLECPSCQRQFAFKERGKRVHGHDITLDDIKKLGKHFKSIIFCGQLSDPVHHPKFIEILKYLYDNNVNVSVHNASSAKSKSWYIKAFKAHPKAEWIFGIDGLPEQSYLYRKNQDGLKLYDIMLEAKKYIKGKIYWQYIIFNYNEDNIEKAKEMARRDGLSFFLIHSSRWRKNDPLIPSLKYRKSKRGDGAPSMYVKVFG